MQRLPRWRAAAVSRLHLESSQTAAVPQDPGTPTAYNFVSHTEKYWRQQWMGELFEKRTLRDLGLRLQLGHWHEMDHRCANPSPSAGEAFVVVDNHGVHEVALDYCGCASSGSQTVQLLRAGLYPATTTNPRSAATFVVLRRFHLLSFESKCSSYEFYYSLARETDNTGLVEIKVSVAHSTFDGDSRRAFRIATTSFCG